MIYRRFLTAFSTIALVCAALEPAPVLADDEAVLGAYDAFRAGDPVRFERYARDAKDDVLAPWVEYWRLKLRIEDASAAEIDPYLARYAGQYLGDQLRLDWLRELGRRGDWAAFERARGPLVQDDPEVRCYAWRARIARGDAQALVESRVIWLEPRELSDGCQSLADELVRRGAAGEDQLWARARVLLASGQLGAARKVLAALPAKARPDERLLSQAAAAPRRVLAQPPRNPDARAARELTIFAVLRLARTDLDAAAAEANGTAAGRLPDGDRAWLWGQLALRGALDLRDDALDWYARAGDAPLDDTQLAWKARAALRAGEWRVVLETLARLSPQALTDPAWTYWRARALAALGDEDGARAAYRRIADGPLYYNVLAAEELGGEAAIPQPFHAPSDEDVYEAQRNDQLGRALELFRLGLRTEGTREWMFAVRAMDDRHLLAAAELALRAGAYDRAIGTAGRTELVHDYRLRYPAPFRDVFKAYAAEHGLEEAWLLGTVRQESRFIADARSGSGASGLMQLLPHTARWVAQRTGYKGYSGKKMTDVETNITLGSRYLLHMLERTGQPVLASTAYNAGPNRVRRWLPAQDMEGAVFVENIPIDETREYVKRVLANTVHYALLLEGRTATLKARLGTIAGRDSSPDEALAGD